MICISLSSIRTDEEGEKRANQEYKVTEASESGKSKGGEPMYAELISSGGGVNPQSLHCIGTGHLPKWIGNCFSGYVPWAGQCEFGFQT